jgi:hypothetical protein
VWIITIPRQRAIEHHGSRRGSWKPLAFDVRLPVRAARVRDEYVLAGVSREKASNRFATPISIVHRASNECDDNSDGDPGHGSTEMNNGHDYHA